MIPRQATWNHLSTVSYLLLIKYFRSVLYKYQFIVTTSPIEYSHLHALKQLHMKTLQNTYCVQYMGVNDDRLEVLTRRVMLDHDAKASQAQKLHQISKDYTIKYERRPPRLKPIFNHNEMEDMENIENEVNQGMIFKYELL